MIVGGSGVSIYPEIFPIWTVDALPYTLIPGTEVTYQDKARKLKLQRGKAYSRE